MINKRKRKRIRSDNRIPTLLGGLIVIATALTVKNHVPVNLSGGITPLVDKIIASKPVTAGKENLHSRDYGEIDRRARAIVYNGHSVKQLAGLLSKQATTEREKARVVYTWIAHNIDYNVEAYLSGGYGDVTPEGVLRERKAVCSGYANLYQALARQMGLESAVISGYGKGAGYVVGTSSRANHAWNGVKIDDKWYLLDATWGAGTVNGPLFQRNFNPHYFATPPGQFIYDHFPEETRWQLLDKPIARGQFDSLAQVSSQFFRDGLSLYSHPGHTIKTNGSVDIVLKAPTDINALAILRQGSREYRDYTRVSRSNGKIIITVNPPRPGTYTLDIFTRRGEAFGQYTGVLAYQIKANTP